MDIRKNDTIYVRTGRDKGKTGKALKINYKVMSVIVEGVNLSKKHTRPKRQGEKGEIISLPRPLDFSKVMLYCPSCGRGVRIGHRRETGGRAERFCRKCNSVL